MRRRDLFLSAALALEARGRQAARCCSQRRQEQQRAPLETTETMTRRCLAERASQSCLAREIWAGVRKSRLASWRPRRLASFTACSLELCALSMNAVFVRCRLQRTKSGGAASSDFHQHGRALIRGGLLRGGQFSHFWRPSSAGCLQGARLTVGGCLHASETLARFALLSAPALATLAAPNKQWAPQVRCKLC